MAASSSTMRGRARSIFSPGQLVECIDDLPEDPGDPNIIPLMGGLTRGRIYTIRWAGYWEGPGQPRSNCVRLAEIHRKPGTLHPHLVDVPYYARRFRPVDDRRLDLFRKMLAQKREIA